MSYQGAIGLSVSDRIIVRHPPHYKTNISRLPFGLYGVQLQLGIGRREPGTAYPPASCCQPPPSAPRRELASHWLSLGAWTSPIGLEEGGAEACPDGTPAPKAWPLGILGGRRIPRRRKYPRTTFACPGLHPSGARVPAHPPGGLRPRAAPAPRGQVTAAGAVTCWGAPACCGHGGRGLRCGQASGGAGGPRSGPHPAAQ